MAHPEPSSIARPDARRISIFNHKGGVGKTILTFNAASAIARLGKRVLLVDSDPQCNLTAYLIEGSVVDDLLDRSDGPTGSTIWSAVKPICDGTGDVRYVSPIELAQKNLFLLPGDIRLSDFEAELTNFWAECFQRKARGFNATTALSRLVSNVCVREKIDFVLYDSGPNIGPLNRAILLDCHFFLIPVACDLFSVRALKTLGRTLATWIREWETICELAPAEMYLLPGHPQFLGYVPQAFSTYRGQVASQNSKYLSMIEAAMHTDIVGVLKEVQEIRPTSGSFQIGSVKDFGSLVIASQREGKPIDSVVSGGTPDQRAQARIVFDEIAKNIVARSA